jgi:hypothetical protein
MHVRSVLLLLLAVLVGAAATARAEEEPAAPPAAPEPESPALARVREATWHLESLRAFRMDATTVFDAVQKNGQKLQFSDRRVLTVRRPDRSRVVWVDDFGQTWDVYYDGQTLTRYDRDDNVYGQIDVPETLDETLDYLELELGAPMPLADLLYSDLSHLGMAAQESEVVSVAYVAGVYCDQLAFRNDQVDWQVWVERGDVPWIRKIVIDYKHLPDRPQFAAFFTSWEANPEVGDAFFYFSLPPKAEKIPTVALPRRGSPQEIELKGDFE